MYMKLFVTLIASEVRLKPRVLISCVLFLLVLRMDELKELRNYGTSIGLKDTDLTKFITEQQTIQGDERHAQRDLEKIKINSHSEIEKERLNV